MKKIDLINPLGSGGLFYVDEVGSTMDAVQKCPSYEKKGTTLLAAYQSQGRGRGTLRKWNSLKEESLLFTTVYPIEELSFQPSLTPLLIGLAICHYLNQEYHLKAKIKWPNDILVEDQKICGILCQMRGDHIFIGVGLNCFQTEFELSHYRTPPTSLSLLGVQASRLPLFLSLLKSINWALHSPDWKPLVEAYLYKNGEEVYINQQLPTEKNSKQDLNKKFKGIIKGLNSQGFLVLEDSKTLLLQEISTGEIDLSYSFKRR